MTGHSQPEYTDFDIAIVTGGSKGIGRATALRLAKEGANVVINYSSDASAADEVVNLIGADRSLAVKADAGNIAELERLVTETVTKFGKIDILVPNAGVMLMKDLETTTEHDFEMSMALNIKGPYFLAQKAAPHIAPGSHIIFLSTTLCATSTVTPNYLLYVTTKGAVEQMTRVMSKDLARKGVSVMLGKSEQVFKMIAGFSPQNRIGTPEEIADVVAFLSGNGSKWITGQTVRVNGGMA
ncbi:hypothetical protein V1515DRAFT_617492 [Lipomyces mesembrius]